MVDQRDEFERSPLHDACTSGQPESVRLLLQSGVDLTIADNNRRTTLHACAEFAHERSLWTLLSRLNEISGQIIRDRFRPACKTSPNNRAWYAEDRKFVSPETKRQQCPNIGLAIRAWRTPGSISWPLIRTTRLRSTSL